MLTPQGRYGIGLFKFCCVSLSLPLSLCKLYYIKMSYVDFVTKCEPCDWQSFFSCSRQQTLTAWRTVFLLAAALSIICTTQYLFLGTDKVQPWNNPKSKSLTGNLYWLYFTSFDHPSGPNHFLSVFQLSLLSIYFLRVYCPSSLSLPACYKIFQS